MSWNPYARELRPNKRLRLAVLAGGTVLHLAGALLILGLPLPIAVIVLLLGSWLGLAWRELAEQWRGYRRVTAICIDKKGFIETIDHAGVRCQVELVAGSFVLQHMAWLRLRFPDSQGYAELLVGDGKHCDAWHWLQLTWRQLGGRIGRVD